MRWMAIFLILAGAAACNTSFFGFDPGIDTVADVEAFIGASLPENARDIYHEDGGFQDVIVWLRFDAPPDEVEEFIEAIGFESLQPSNGTHVDYTGPGKSWWMVGEMQAPFVGHRANYLANRHYTILVDQADPSSWRVYLFCFTT